MLSIILDNPSFDNSIVGVDENGRVIYSFDKMIEELSQEDSISLDEAAEYIEYNAIRAIPYMGEYAPIICYELLN